jgi:monothiol glutaredoxin
MALDEALRTQLSDLIGKNRVVLFMKGTRNFPQCGFSATVTQILDDLIDDYHTVNVLKEPAIREGIKEFSNWPTIPQLYVEGKFVGGCDIVRELYQSGELQGLLGVEAAPVAAPKLTVTPAAREAIERMRDGDAGMLRLEVSAQFEHGLSLDDKRDDDLEVDAGGVAVLVDRASATRADGVTIDFAAQDGGFRIDNPAEPPRVKQLAPVELKRMLDAGENVRVYDVRTEEERALAQIAGTPMLDEAALRELDALPRDTALVLYCHTGQRSQAAAQRLLHHGFTRVYNLAGGIDRWSREVDTSVSRY